MEETTEQYITRLLANVGDRNPLKVQAATAEKLERLVRRLPRAKLRQRPGPDKWSIAEIVAHLADAEIVISWRIRAILGAPGTPIQAYDQNVWAGRFAQSDDLDFPLKGHFRLEARGGTALTGSYQRDGTTIPYAWSAIRQ